MNRFKTLALAAAAASTLMIGVASQADARPFHRHHGGLGWGVGALAAGLIVGGAIAAANSRAEAGECYVTRRWVETPYGMERRTVRVCE